MESRDPIDDIPEDRPVALARFARKECEALECALREIERGLERGLEADQLEAAGARAAAWRRQLARHLDWEESAVLPAYAAHGGGDHLHVVFDHERSHRSLLGLVTDLVDLLRPGHGTLREGEARSLLESLKRKLAMHRDREIHGLCAALDSSLPRSAIDELESARCSS